MAKNLKECEQLMIDFAKERNFTPEEMLTSFQTALLNIAGWVCTCMGYPDDEYERFMMDYVNELKKSVEQRFRKEE